MTRIPVGSTVTSFPARTWNQLVDRLLGDPPPGLPQSVRGEPRAGQVVIEVEPQTDVGELGVLILDEPVFLPTATTGGGNDTADAATLQAPAMRAVAPATANLSGAVAITLEPIASGNRGRAVVQGVSWARVDIQTAGDTACGPIDADKTRLESGAGALTILWAEKADAGTKTGEQWCLVLLGGGGGLSRGEYVTVKVTANVPARVSDAAGTADPGGLIVAVCAPLNAGESSVTIAGLEYDFTSASAGDIVEPEDGGVVALVNTSRSQVTDATGDVYWHAKYLGESAVEDDPPWYELIAPTELRSLTAWDGDGTADQVITHVDGDIEWEDTGECS